MSSVARRWRASGVCLSLLLMGAAAGCGGGGAASSIKTGTHASPTVPVAKAPTATTAAEATTATTSPAGTATAASSQTGLSAVDAQLKGLDGDLTTSDSALSTQEGDPTK